MTEFGTVLKKLRLENSLTQKQLAEHLNISESTIGMYEQNRRKPDYEILDAIADYFNVDMDFLLGRTNTKQIYSVWKNMLLNDFELLNDLGQQEAVKRVNDLTLIEKYSRNILNAAARNGNIRELPDNKLIDDDINNTDDPDFL